MRVPRLERGIAHRFPESTPGALVTQAEICLGRVCGNSLASKRCDGYYSHTRESKQPFFVIRRLASIHYRDGPKGIRMSLRNSGFLLRTDGKTRVLFEREDGDGVDGAGLVASVAAGAEGVVDGVALVGGEGDGVDGTGLDAAGAADAAGGDFVADEGLAAAGGAAAFEVSLKLFAEVGEGAEYGVGRGAAEPAEAVLLDGMGELFEPFEIAVAGFALAEPFEDDEHGTRAGAAGGAFAATLVLCEGEEVAGDVDHAIGFVEDDHAA